MKTPATDLYDLIQSMTKNEKGYFKKFALRHASDDNNNILLFKVLDKLKSYDESVVMDKLKKTKMVNKLSVYKRNLYRLVLKSLRAFHAEKNVDYQLAEWLQYASILFEKGLYKQLSKLLEKMGAIARQHERFELLYEIFRRKEHLLVYFPEQYRKEEYEQKKWVLDQLSVFKEYYYASSKIMNEGVRVNLKRDEDKEQYYKAIWEDTIIGEEREPASLREAVVYNSLRAGLLWRTGKVKEASENYKEAIRALESTDSIYEDITFQYGRIVANIISTASELRDFEDIRVYTDKYLAFREKYVSKNKTEPFNTIQLHLFIMGVNINAKNAIGDFEGALKLFESIKQDFRQYSIKLSAPLYAHIKFSLGVAYFGNEAYNEAIDFWNEVEEGEHGKIDLVAASKMMKLLCHLELQNMLFLEYSIKSVYRFLKKYEMRNVLYKKVLTMIKSIATKDIKSVGAGDYQKMIAELKQVSSDAEAKKSLTLFNYIAWLESKVRRISLGQVLQEQTNA